MSPALAFVSGTTATLLAGVAVARYLNGPLRRQLQELCGSVERAEFWTVFSKVALILMPLIFALQVDPLAPDAPPILSIAGQFKWGLIGLVGTVLMLGWILSRFIPRGQPARPVPPPPPMPGGAI
jgi:hypothetical protein